ncbi:hypothetical protein LOK46_25570 [Methylobacterium sp. NMS14P]|uniref:hypothetical protein n=1 Tax=Methylobacterium sp. NMS14P TaxID=2894310 RepID=UPI002358F97C|nr:hypothetical protein [Methylobacterium sp. NMS14P]WCS24464.1 hypothetical protein LOK46_25570 [Methylobacterium sp. NMS14P]
MADEPLRMEVEVRDKFTGPLKAFRQHLLDAARSGADHSETLTKGFGKVEGALQGTARTAQTVLNPALSALGVTGLGVGVAVAGIAGALRNLSGNLTALGQLSRETGVAADTLRVFGSVASKFNVDQDTMAAGTKNFVANLREFRMHGNETFAWLQSQGRTTEGRSAFQNLAKDLRNSTDAGEALKKALQFGEQIKDPTERGIFFQKLFGNADLARVADGHLGKLEDVWKKTQARLPPLDPKAILKAEEFDRAVADLRGSMKSIGTTIASEVLPFASDFTKWIDDIVKDQRGDFMKALRESLQGVSRELRGIDWKTAGESAKDMLVSTTGLVTSLAHGIHDIADVIAALKKGEYAEAFARADSMSGPAIAGKDEGADGPLRRRLAPRLGDDEIAARQRVEELTKLRDAAKEAGGYFIGRTQQRMGLLDTPEAAQKKLEEAQAELSRLQARTPEQRERDFRESADKLRRSMDGLSETIKGQKDAKVSKSSAEDDGLFGGARIQTASFGGGGGGYRRYGGGSGPGYVGEAGPAGPGAGRSYGGGRLNGLGDGGAPSPRLPGIGGRTHSVPQATMPPRTQGGVPTGSDAGNLTALIEREARAAGIDPRIMEGIRAGESGHRHNRGNPRAAYDHNPGTRAIPEDSWGPFQLNRRRGTGQEFERDTGLDLSDPRTIPDQVRYVAQYLRKKLAKNPRYSPYPNWQGYRGNRDADPRWGDSGYVPEQSGSPTRLPGGGDFLPNGAPRVLKPDSMRGAPGLTMSESDRMRAGKADGDAWAAREKARKEFDRRLQAGDERLTASASRAGVGGGKLEANGSVYVQVHRPGPETQVSTSASGNLFRDVQMRRGQAMEKAGGG